MPQAAFGARDGHQIKLLQGSREYLPALIAAIDRARNAVRLETYIFDFTGDSAAVAEALIRAAQRGVVTWVLVDGVGTEPLPPSWDQRFAAAGVQWRVYSPLGRLGLLIPSRWRRLHRKLCVVDGRLAFCGGINILDDLHDPYYGRLSHPRLDFAVRASGALAQQAHAATAQLWWRIQAVQDARQRHFPQALDTLREASLDSRWTQDDEGAERDDRRVAHASLLLRDNLLNRGKIERAYRKAIGSAREEIILANAYFLPGRKLRQALMHAAQRGVKVRLLLQGRYEYFMQFHAARPVYGDLMSAGVEIHEYTASFLHAKVAVIDATGDRPWATVGSSNLDPLSLLLAREANVVVEDAHFAAELRGRLLQVMAQECRRVEVAEYANRPLRQRIMERIALGLLRIGVFLTGKRY